MPNLNFIKRHGIRKFIEQQKKRIQYLGVMLRNFNDGRSRSFFCRAAVLLDLKDLENSLNEANRKVKADRIRDIKIKAKVLKNILNQKFLDKE